MWAMEWKGADFVSGWWLDCCCLPATDGDRAKWPERVKSVVRAQAGGW